MCVYCVCTGFRYNLERGEMRVGGLVSTSNILDSDELTVETDNELLWTTQLRDSPDSPSALS
jgi:thiamine pyrophosphokinase